MDTLEKLSEGKEKAGEGKNEAMEPEAKELIVHEYFFEQSGEEGTQPAPAIPSAGPQKLYPGVFMTPKPSYRKMSFAPGRTHPLIIGVTLKNDV